jgi:signal peptide peptidase SppA
MPPPDLHTLSVPAFPRVEEYAGLWAIESTRAAMLWDVATKANLAAHVAEAQPPKLQSEIMRQPLPDGRHIAVLAATGLLMKQRSSFSGGTSTVQLRRDVRSAANNPDVAAILLAIDSPGGTVAGTGDLAADLANAAAKKPLWAQIEDLGASAAYWLASQGAKVFANHPTALVGSIGTIIRLYDVSRAAENEGVKTLVFSTGPLKGAGTPGLPIGTAESAYFQRLADEAQQSFDAAVTAGRKFTPAQLDAVKSGEVFSAAAALRLGLIDGVQTLEVTLAALAREVAGQANQGGRKMAGENSVGPLTVAVEANVDLAETRRQLAAETRRVAAVREACGSRHPAVEAQAIEEGWDEPRTRQAVELADLRNSRPASPGIITRSHDRDCTLQALQGAMVLRSGGKLDHPAFQSQQAMAIGVPQWLRAGLNSETRQRAMEAAWQYRDMSMLDVCREAVRLDGRDVPHGRAELIQAAFSGSALTAIFTTNVNTMILSTYSEAGDTTGGWTSSADVADFKTNERPRMSKGPNLKKLPRGGEADHLSRSDLAESYKIARYARQFVVDEQDIIDDSFNALADTPGEMGLAAARLRPDLVYAILLRNAALGADSVALFHASHLNLNTSAALASAKLIACIAALEKQRENGVNLNLRASHLIVPSDLKHTGAELIRSATILLGADDETVRGSENTIRSIESLTLVSDARLSNGVTDPVDDSAQSGSTSTWYLASSMGHNIEVAYLRGTGRAPQVRTFMLSKGKWGMGWDVKMDIGAKALDYRGMQKNTA